MRERFTRVLKGHIAIARAVFPDGTTGAQLDTLARQFLWAAGLDFDHGTGHGVGSYLSVHEGPARISKLGTARAQARHDPVERARLLQDRRLRHPHREPGAGGRGAARRRRREAAQRVRDADAGADRPAAGRRRRCSPPRRSPGSTATTPASPRRSRRSSMPRPAPGLWPQPVRSARAEARRGLFAAQDRTKSLGSRRARPPHAWLASRCC